MADRDIFVKSAVSTECILKCGGWTISVSCSEDKNVLWKNLKVTIADQRASDSNRPNEPPHPLLPLSEGEWRGAKKKGLSAIAAVRKRARKAAERNEREPRFL